MKFSDKLTLILQGKSSEEIAALEAEETAEAEAAAAARAAEEAAAKAAEEDAARTKTALEAAQSMVKELEEKLSAKEDELTKLNKEFADLNNKRTIKDEPEAHATGADVMKELFNNKKKEE